MGPNAPEIARFRQTLAPSKKRTKMAMTRRNG
jgi:hypothetical protein